MKDWKKVLGGIAPTIATALGGPLAGTATKFLASSLLGKDEASESELEAAIIGAIRCMSASIQLAIARRDWSRVRSHGADLPVMPRIAGPTIRNEKPGAVEQRRAN